jgi:multidrug efflux pump subunit AcrA (membrane-fusion protein)
MSAVLSPPDAAKQTVVQTPRGLGRGSRYVLFALITLTCILIAGACFFLYKRSAASSPVDVPTTKVARGDVSMSIFARGEVRGGNSQMLTAPMTGGTELHLRTLVENGSPVRAGEVVAQFDTTDQEFALKEAQSDLAEAEQHIKQATAQLAADTEEDRYALEKAQSDLELAELEARKNPILPLITAKQNDLAVTSFRSWRKTARTRRTRMRQESKCRRRRRARLRPRS